MLIYVAMILGAVSVLCIGLTARRLAADRLALVPPLTALCTALLSVALMLTAAYTGQ
ncbi:hypothetical protein ACN2WE_01925 [Streptomyces sp. cg28]|uniref:hypothetical protein n=1 Tax=unclassified Streptomyces TaxID=2593676 RepID=UPI000DC33F74|nr:MULTISPECIES: hypothetical protein [unclassified Streptomyces]MYT68997.1 hypothetical protein [Streptomyces sp. SID8367]RAJ82505.1 hypothetical protein K377_04225 [Streptomyces sp. PsTaAH-137]